MKTIDVEIQAVSGVPLLMNTWFGIDPMNPIVQELKKLRGTASKQRTEEWHAESAKLDWTLSLYHDPDIGPYMPAENVEGSLTGGARKARLGKTFKASMMVEPARIPLLYDGPREPDALYADVRFVDRRPCEAGTMKTRPRFYDWKMKFSVIFDEAVIDARQVKAALEAASIWGLGSYRPKFGKFDVVKFQEK